MRVTDTRAVIFDWAGTMIDFGSCAPVDAMQRVFAEAGVPVTDDDVRRHMGRAKRDHIAAILGEPSVATAWLARHGDAPSEADVDAIFAALEPVMLEAAGVHATLIPGAAGVAAQLRSRGIRIGSCTGYTRAMMQPILSRAAEQGYAPDAVVCAGETAEGRPSPLMVWKNLVELGVWPAGACIKVDDAEVGMAEGRNAGCITVGIAASGNLLGLSLDRYEALSTADREARLTGARERLFAAGADHVIDTVADLPRLMDELAI